MGHGHPNHGEEKLGHGVSSPEHANGVPWTTDESAVSGSSVVGAESQTGHFGPPPPLAANAVEYGLITAARDTNNAPGTAEGERSAHNQPHAFLEGDPDQPIGAGGVVAHAAAGAAGTPLMEEEGVYRHAGGASQTGPGAPDAGHLKEVMITSVVEQPGHVPGAAANQLTNNENITEWALNKGAPAPHAELKNVQVSSAINQHVPGQTLDAGGAQDGGMGERTAAPGSHGGHPLGNSLEEVLVTSVTAHPPAPNVQQGQQVPYGIDMVHGAGPTDTASKDETLTRHGHQLMAEPGVPASGVADINGDGKPDNFAGTVHVAVGDVNGDGERLYNALTNNENIIADRTHPPATQDAAARHGAPHQSQFGYSGESGGMNGDMNEAHVVHHPNPVANELTNVQISSVIEHPDHAGVVGGIHAEKNQDVGESLSHHTGHGAPDLDAGHSTLLAAHGSTDVDYLGGIFGLDGVHDPGADHAAQGHSGDNTHTGQVHETGHLLHIDDAFLAPEGVSDIGGDDGIAHHQHDLGHDGAVHHL